MQLTMYYMGNQVYCPLWGLGNLDDYYIPSSDAGTTYINTLRLGAGWAGNNSLCAGYQTPPGSALEPTQVINTSNTPLLPTLSSTRKLEFASNPWTEYGSHDYKATGGTSSELDTQINNYNTAEQTGNQVYLAYATVAGESHLGFLVYNTDGGSWGFVYNDNENSTLDTIFDLATKDFDPGEKGFEPTIDINDGKSIGGRGKGSGDGHSKRPEYKTDEITQPGAPDESSASAVGSGLIHAYKITTENLGKVGACLYGETIMDKLANMLINPLDFLVSLNIFPCMPSHIGFSGPITLGRWECKEDLTHGGLGFRAVGWELTRQFEVLNFGTLEVGENWGSFLDYTHTKAELYLPFIGTIDLDVSEFMNGSINVKYTIDFFTGACVANVLCRKTTVIPSKNSLGTTANQYAQHSYQGNCAMSVPLTAVQYGGMIGSVINSVGKGITTGNPAVALGAMAGDFLSGNARPQATSKGSITSNGGFCSVLYPYIRIVRPITNVSESYQTTEGYPSYIDSSLSACDGLAVCDSINLSGVSGATDSELERIEQLCKQGVYV